MALHGGHRFAVAFEELFPMGAFCMGVEPETDFDRRDAADPQKRDKDTGERVWVVRVIDGDPEAAKRGQAETKVRLTGPHQPVPPAASGGFPYPAVEFDGLTLTPWVDGQRCKARPVTNGECKGRTAFSIRAAVMRAPGRVAKSAPSAQSGERAA